MHEPVNSRLEECLARPDHIPGEVQSHLQACDECRAELQAMAAQARIIRTLKRDSELEPAPGFYARVMDFIDQQRPVSIWSVFMDAFGRRLAVASAALVVLMGIYLVSSSPAGRPAPMQIAPESISAVDLSAGREDMPAPVLTGAADQEQVRNAVFVNLATYRE